MQHRDIIDELGGHRELALALGYRPNRVLKWRIRDSIPPVVWPLIVDIAAAKRFPLNVYNLQDGYKYAAVAP